MADDTKESVLRLLAAGDLTVEEAEARLDALDPVPVAPARPAAPPRPDAPLPPSDGPARSRRREGSSKLSVDDLVALAAVGAKPDWVRRMQALDIKDLDTGTLIALACHDVQPEWIEELAGSGLFGELTSDQIVGLAAHGVDISYVREMKDALQAEG